MWCLLWFGFVVGDSSNYAFQNLVVRLVSSESSIQDVWLSLQVQLTSLAIPCKVISQPKKSVKHRLADIPGQVNVQSKRLFPLYFLASISSWQLFARSRGYKMCWVSIEHRQLHKNTQWWSKICNFTQTLTVCKCVQQSFKKILKTLQQVEIVWPAWYWFPHFVLIEQTRKPRTSCHTTKSYAVHSLVLYPCTYNDPSAILLKSGNDNIGVLVFPCISESGRFWVQRSPHLKVGM